MSTDTNPADLLSRGISPDEQADAQLWWNGPPWLVLPPTDWPKHPHIMTKDTVLQYTACMVEPTPKQFYYRFSNFGTLKRSFRHHFNRPKLATTTYITLSEQQWVKKVLIQLAQKHSFPIVIDTLRKDRLCPPQHQLYKLRPSLMDGTLRV